MAPEPPDQPRPPKYKVKIRGSSRFDRSFLAEIGGASGFELGINSKIFAPFNNPALLTAGYSNIGSSGHQSHNISSDQFSLRGALPAMCGQRGINGEDVHQIGASGVPIKFDQQWSSQREIPGSTNRFSTPRRNIFATANPTYSAGSICTNPFADSDYQDSSNIIFPDNFILPEVTGSSTPLVPEPTKGPIRIVLQSHGWRPMTPQPSQVISHQMGTPFFVRPIRRSEPIIRAILGCPLPGSSNPAIRMPSAETGANEQHKNLPKAAPDSAVKERLPSANRARSSVLPSPLNHSTGSEEVGIRAIASNVEIAMPRPQAPWKVPNTQTFVNWSFRHRMVYDWTYEVSLHDQIPVSVRTIIEDKPVELTPRQRERYISALRFNENGSVEYPCMMAPYLLLHQKPSQELENPVVALGNRHHENQQDGGDLRVLHKEESRKVAHKIEDTQKKNKGPGVESSALSARSRDSREGLIQKNGDETSTIDWIVACDGFRKKSESANNFEGTHLSSVHSVKSLNSNATMFAETVSGKACDQSRSGGNALAHVLSGRSVEGNSDGSRRYQWSSEGSQREAYEVIEMRESAEEVVWEVGSVVSLALRYNPDPDSTYGRVMDVLHNGPARKRRAKRYEQYGNLSRVFMTDEELQREDSMNAGNCSPPNNNITMSSEKTTINPKPTDEDPTDEEPTPVKEKRLTAKEMMLSILERANVPYQPKTDQKAKGNPEALEREQSKQGASSGCPADTKRPEKAAEMLRRILDRQPKQNKPSAQKAKVVQKMEPSVVQKTDPLVVQKTEPSDVQNTEPSVAQKTEPSVVQNTEPSIVQKTDPSDVQKTEPSVVQKMEPSKELRNIILNIEPVKEVGPSQESSTVVTLLRVGGPDMPLHLASNPYARSKPPLKSKAKSPGEKNSTQSTNPYPGTNEGNHHERVRVSLIVVPNTNTLPDTPPGHPAKLGLAFRPSFAHCRDIEEEVIIFKKFAREIHRQVRFGERAKQRWEVKDIFRDDKFLPCLMLDVWPEFMITCIRHYANTMPVLDLLDELFAQVMYVYSCQIMTTLLDLAITGKGHPAFFITSTGRRIENPPRTVEPEHVEIIEKFLSLEEIQKSLRRNYYDSTADIGHPGANARRRAQKAERLAREEAEAQAAMFGHQNINPNEGQFDGYDADSENIPKQKIIRQSEAGLGVTYERVPFGTSGATIAIPRKISSLGNQSTNICMPPGIPQAAGQPLNGGLENVYPQWYIPQGSNPRTLNPQAAQIPLNNVPAGYLSNGSAGCPIWQHDYSNTAQPNLMPQSPFTNHMGVGNVMPQIQFLPGNVPHGFSGVFLQAATPSIRSPNMEPYAANIFTPAPVVPPVKAIAAHDIAFRTAVHSYGQSNAQNILSQMPVGHHPFNYGNNFSVLGQSSGNQASMSRHPLRSLDGSVNSLRGINLPNGAQPQKGDNTKDNTKENTAGKKQQGAVLQDKKENVNQEPAVNSATENVQVASEYKNEAIEKFFKQNGGEGFVYNKTQRFETELYRLNREQRWAPTKWRRLRTEFCKILANEFDAKFGDHQDLENWVNLCIEFGASPIDTGKMLTMGDCIEFIKRSYISIFDLLNARAFRQPIRHFQTREQLIEYVCRGRQFPLKAAKPGGPMACLLQQLGRA